MSSAASIPSQSATPGTAEHFDVLIVGAGISGVGGAYHLTHQCPGTRFVVLDALEHVGRTSGRFLRREEPFRQATDEASHTGPYGTRREPSIEMRGIGARVDPSRVSIIPAWSARTPRRLGASSRAHSANRAPYRRGSARFPGSRGSAAPAW